MSDFNCDSVSPASPVLVAATGSKGGVKAIVLIAHLGQPKLMAKDFKRENYTLRPAAEVLKTHLGVPVGYSQSGTLRLLQALCHTFGGLCLGHLPAGLRWP